MIPILYAKDTQDFDNFGLGLLKDAVKAVVTEERNGAYEMTLQYPVTGQWYNLISDGCIIKAKPNEAAQPQLFRIYKTSKPIKSVVTYWAEHISYMLNGFPIESFSVANRNAQQALEKALSQSPFTHPFTAYSDIETTNNTSICTPCSLRAVLGGQSGSILDVWGGEYEFDNFQIKLHANRGQDKGITVAYGKNLSDLTQTSEIETSYTHIMPYAVYTEYDEEGNGTDIYVHLPERVLAIPNAANIGYNKAFVKDFSGDFGEEEIPTEETLRARANAYLETTTRASGKVHLKASFVQLWQTEEYKNVAPLEKVCLCDTVTIVHPELNIKQQAKVIKTVYDVLREKYESIEIGDVKSTFADTIKQQEDDIEELKTRVGAAESQSREIKQEFKAADGQLLSTISETFATKEETSSAINQTSEEIMLEVNKKVDDEDFGTKITQNSESVKIAWNNCSDYIDFANGALNIYSSAGKQQSGKLMTLDRDACKYYRNGNHIGDIGTGDIKVEYEGQTYSEPSLLFNLDFAKYMTWGTKATDTDDSYTPIMQYVPSTTETGLLGYGFHFGAPVHSENNIRISPYSYLAEYENGDGGLTAYFGHKLVLFSGSGIIDPDNPELDEFANAVIISPTATNIYATLDMHNNAIVNQSDARMKTNIKDTGINALDLINCIELKEFDWLENGEHEQIGIIAQQLREHIPELVYENPENGKLSIKENKFVPYFIKAIQELYALVCEYKARDGGEALSVHNAREKWTDGFPLSEKREFVKKIHESELGALKERKCEIVKYTMQNGTKKKSKN